MNYKDYSEIQRLLGVIEGVAFTTSNTVQSVLIDTIALINEILERDLGNNNVE